MAELIITPKTKVAELLSAYPQLEQALIGYVPAFEKLRNPVLRRTIARITTLQQAATIGNVKVEELINSLRKEVGQDRFAGEAAAAYRTERPAWFFRRRVSCLRVGRRDLRGRGKLCLHGAASGKNGTGLGIGSFLRTTQASS